MDAKLKETIENVIGDIMIIDGPDGHSDGCGVIADYIESIVDGEREEWEKAYFDGSTQFGGRTKTRFLSADINTEEE